MNVSMEMHLSGRTALVSGSTKGIGRAIAAGLGRAGASVVVNGRDAAGVEATVRERGQEVPEADFPGVAADLPASDGAERLFAELPDADILINNLGIFAPQPVLEID